MQSGLPVNNTELIILKKVFKEIDRAQNMHGVWPKDIFEGLAIIGEELGEACQAAIEAKYRGAPKDDIRKEVEQVACTALRFLFAWKED